MTRALSTAIVCMIGWQATLVHAGPVEIFQQVSSAPNAPAHLAVPYSYGGGGMFVGRDGAELGLLCAAAIDSSVQRQRFIVNETGDGELLVAAFAGVWRADADGCGFQAAPALPEHYISAFANDPREPKRTFLVTSDAEPQHNSVYVSVAKGAAFEPFGKLQPGFLETLHVVQVGMQRRFYETAIAHDAGSSETHYAVRVSDDDATTWSDDAFDIGAFEPQVAYPSFAIVAVDPTNADHVVGVITRDSDIDTLVHSTQRGKRGTWSKLAEATILSAVTFTADGALYLGDDDPSHPALFMIEPGSEEVTQLSDSWPVACLRYDTEHDRLYACSRYLFGTVELGQGALVPLLDMRCAEHFVACPGQRDTREVCAAQLFPDNYCNSTHYPAAPVCAGYDTSATGADFIDNRLEYRCEDGVAHAIDRQVMYLSSSKKTETNGAVPGAAGPLELKQSANVPFQAKGKPRGCSVAHAQPEPRLMPWLLPLCVGIALRIRSKRRARARC